MSERKVDLEILCLMHGYRPSDMAIALQVTRAHISRLHSGVRGLSVARVREIAALLGEPVAEVRKAYNINALPQFVLPPILPDEAVAEQLSAEASVAVA